MTALPIADRQYRDLITARSLPCSIRVKPVSEKIKKKKNSGVALLQ